MEENIALGLEYTVLPEAAWAIIIFKTSGKVCLGTDLLPMK